MVYIAKRQKKSKEKNLELFQKRFLIEKDWTYWKGLRFPGTQETKKQKQNLMDKRFEGETKYWEEKSWI